MKKYVVIAEKPPINAPIIKLDISLSDRKSTRAIASTASRANEKRYSNFRMWYASFSEGNANKALGRAPSGCRYIVRVLVREWMRLGMSQFHPNVY